MYIFTEYNTIITAVSIGLVAILLIWVLWLELRLHWLTKGSDGKNLENHIANIARDYKSVQVKQQEMTDKITSVDARLSSAIRGIGLTRFNPFAGSGNSKPSFAIALIDEAGNGIIISTLCARDNLTLFSKQVVDFKPENEITEEEQNALEKACKSLHNAGHHAKQN